MCPGRGAAPFIPHQTLQPDNEEVQTMLLGQPDVDVKRRANKGKCKERGDAMHVGGGRTKYGCEIIDNPHSVRPHSSVFRSCHARIISASLQYHYRCSPRSPTTRPSSPSSGTRTASRATPSRVCTAAPSPVSPTFFLSLLLILFSLSHTHTPITTCIDLT
jgi:hypothetical protein